MTLYANLVNVRDAGQNVVLEFASFFPDAELRLPPREFPCDVRVVVPRHLITPLIDILRARTTAPSHDHRDNRPQ